MSETVIAALIAGSVTLIVCVVNNLFQQKRLANKVSDQQRQMAEEQRHALAMLELKLDHLTDQVGKHNNLIDRMYHMEEKAALQEEKIKVANHRLDDLEKQTSHKED